MKNFNVLSVDDHTSILIALRAVLEDSGYEVLTASSGEEVNLASTVPSMLTALLDLAMPKWGRVHPHQQAEGGSPGNGSYHNDGTGHHSHRR